MVESEGLGNAQSVCTARTLGLVSAFRARDEPEQPKGCSDPAGFAAAGGSFQFASANCRTGGFVHTAIFATNKKGSDLWV